MERTFIETGGATHRGEHRLPHQSRQIRRDLHGEDIAMHPNDVAMGYRRTAEQVEECRRGTGFRAGLPYEFLIYVPGRPSYSWTAFFSRESMSRWLDAYGLTLDREPEPGETFNVRLPADNKGWQALTVH